MARLLLNKTFLVYQLMMVAFKLVFPQEILFSMQKRFDIKRTFFNILKQLLEPIEYLFG